MLALGAAACALVASGCSHGAALMVDSVSATRIVSNDQDNGKIQVDVEVRATEQGGGAIGNYCVAVYWFTPGVNPEFVPVALAYPFSPSRVLCSDGGNEPGVRLDDGDRRVVRFLSNETNLVPGQPFRAQANVGTIIDAKDESTP
ncbi:hypothetical protein AKJ09_07710 [Labilithrix luteola]|uniref:Lipoprotein n=1 Tax=Labilithrix luteola TaxID=1391654 RepID=A0A0K1Q5V8_9BACT|nr:hypothetical protein AKJ09_07710 [Labilithrix luteola]